ncbi:MAG: hypothetical protein JW750_04490 [Anaerolineaceae bacterium]|nr:hypothetical protein [Anaerolineaceae bacterium]
MTSLDDFFANLDEFFRFLFQREWVTLLPLIAFFVVLAAGVVLAFRLKQFPARNRWLAAAGLFVLWLSLLLEFFQPILQFYLEEEVGIIFLEVNKVTGLMRNYHFVLYPVGMLLMGFAIFTDRYEARWDDSEADDAG